MAPRIAPSGDTGRRNIADATTETQTKASTKLGEWLLVPRGAIRLRVSMARAAYEEASWGSTDRCYLTRCRDGAELAHQAQVVVAAPMFDDAAVGDANDVHA